MSNNQEDKIVPGWKDRHSFYRQCFDENVSGIYIANIDGYLITCNDVFAKIFGFSSAAEATGTKLESFFPDGRSMTNFLELIMKEKKIIGHESTLCGRDGVEKTILQNAIGVFDENGKLIEIRGFLVDLTQQKNMERQVSQTQKIEAIGTLAGGIAHDFNNLLMTIQGNVSLMLMDTDESHPFFKQLTAIEEKIFEGASLTSHILGYARKGKYEVCLLNLNHLIQETSEAFGRMRKEIVIKKALAKNIYRVKADRSQMEQVLLSLFANAAEAMPSGGVLKIEMDTVTNEWWTGAQYKPRPGSYVRILIEDNGIGMSMEAKSRIFDPSFSIKNKERQGTGLILSAAYGIIKGHNGYIEVESKCDRGTVFCIYLPIFDDEGKTMGKTDEVNQPKNGKEKIMIVDDDVMVLDVGGKVLEKLKYQVFNANGGAEAVEILKQHKSEIDIVILDMIMPKMNCEDTFDQLKAINPKVKVLLSSGYDMNGQAQKMMERGCDGFIQKPFRVNEISKKIADISSYNSTAAVME